MTFSVVALVSLGWEGKKLISRELAISSWIIRHIPDLQTR